MGLIIKILTQPGKALRRGLSTVFNVLRFKLKGVSFKKLPYFDGMVQISRAKDSHISFGRDVYLNSGRKCNPVGFEHKMMISAAKGGSIVVGDHVGMSNTVIYATEAITIGNNVMLGNGVKIYDTDFHSLRASDRLAICGDNTTKSAAVTIQDGAFIGAGTTILKGVTIGEGAIVGACSVVAKSIPAREIWAGNPATFIRCCESES